MAEDGDLCSLLAGRTWRQLGDPGLRACAEVVLLAGDGATVQARFILSRCIPLKLKAPALNAKDGGIAVEELQLAYESLEWRPPQS